MTAQHKAVPGILRVAYAVGLVLAIALTAATVSAYVVSERQFRRRYPVPSSKINARTDSAAITRGRHLYRTITCTTCHGDDGGGALYADVGPIGILAGPNLTRGRGGVADLRSDEDIVRAVRFGVRPDSTSLLVMPSEVFTHLSDADLAALIGFVRQLPPVDRELPRSRLRWLGRALLAAGRLNLLVAPKTHGDALRREIPAGRTVEYGRYLADIAGCHGCHGYSLSGGAVAGPPGLPPASNLTPEGMRGYAEASFLKAMRSGRRPDGSLLNTFMPWQNFAQMSDTEIGALWDYLRSVPSRPFGGK